MKLQYFLYLGTFAYIDMLQAIEEATKIFKGKGNTQNIVQTKEVCRIRGAYRQQFCSRFVDQAANVISILMVVCQSVLVLLEITNIPQSFSCSEVKSIL